MSEEGFWDAIREDPREPVNWGVFADFLEENSDPRANPVRAVFNALKPPDDTATPGDAAQQRQALLDAARAGHLRGWPLEALPAIVELFDIGIKPGENPTKQRELRYADYLDIAAAVTATANSGLSVDEDEHFDASRCTRLQAEYLRGDLAEGGGQRALLADIRTELRKIPGLEELPDERIPANQGRIHLHASGTGITALPEGLHITGSAYFKDCGALTGVSHIHAGGYAYFRDCGKLTGAHHIHVGVEADFRGCGELKTLGEGCRIGENLWLTDSGVTGLLDDIYIGKNIHDIPHSFTLGNLRPALDYEGISKKGKKDIEKEIISRLQQEPGEGVNDPNLTQGGPYAGII